MVDLAQPPQHGGHQQPREGPVADREPLELRMALECLVERAVIGPEHAVEDVERDASGVRVGCGVGGRAGAAARPPGGLLQPGLAPGEPAALATRRLLGGRVACARSCGRCLARQAPASISARVSAAP